LNASPQREAPATVELLSVDQSAGFAETHRRGPTIQAFQHQR